MATAKKTVVKKAAVKKTTKKSVRELLLAEHKPFGIGDRVYVMFIPYKGDAFGSTKDYDGYFETDQYESYAISSYNPKTGEYMLPDMDGGMSPMPFYVLKLHKKNNGRTISVAGEEGEINLAGTSVQIGCRTVSFTEVKNVYDMMMKVQAKKKAAK
jgi:hypothetical protein